MVTASEFISHWATKIKTLLARPEVQLTIIYAMCFGILGSVMSGMGPSLPELGRRTNSTDEAMGWILGVRAFGYFLGSMGGPLFDSLPGNRVLIVALSICSISCALMGFVRVYGLLFVVVPFQGMCMGLLDTGGNVMTLWLHPKDPEPFMQALHFAFAIGGLVSPLLIGQIAKHNSGSITVSWLIIAALFIPIILLLTRYESPKEPPRPVTEDGSIVQYSGWTLVVLIGTAAFLFFDIGAEAAVATYIVTYIVRRELAGETTATVVNSWFWVFMVVGRLIAIPVSMFVKSHYIIITSSILTCASTLIWLIFYKSFAVLTVAMILYGLGMSVAFATGVLLAQYYIPISGRAGTVFVVGAACGEFIIPATLSQLFTVTKYMSLPTFMLGSAVVCLGLVFFNIWAGEKCPKTVEAPKPELDIETSGHPNGSSELTHTGADGNHDGDSVKLEFEMDTFNSGSVDAIDKDKDAEHVALDI
jgi:fucose permease